MKNRILTTALLIFSFPVLGATAPDLSGILVEPIAHVFDMPDSRMALCPLAIGEDSILCEIFKPDPEACETETDYTSCISAVVREVQGGGEALAGYAHAVCRGCEPAEQPTIGSEAAFQICESTRCGFKVCADAPILKSGLSDLTMTPCRPFEDLEACRASCDERVGR